MRRRGIGVSQIGWASASIEFAHDTGVLLLVAVFHFNAAQPLRVLDHHATALPSSRVEAVERVLQAVGPAELVREHDPALDADAGAGRQMWGRGGDRISDHDDAAAVPWHGHEQIG